MRHLTTLKALLRAITATWRRALAQARSRTPELPPLAELLADERAEDEQWQALVAAASHEQLARRG